MKIEGIFRIAQSVCALYREPSIMDQRPAIDAAKRYLNDAYLGEVIEAVSLEEISRLANNDWMITLSFRRPSDRASNAMAALQGRVELDRVYKCLHVRDSDGQVLSMKNRR